VEEKHPKQKKEAQTEGSASPMRLQLQLQSTSTTPAASASSSSSSSTVAPVFFDIKAERRGPAGGLQLRPARERGGKGRGGEGMKRVVDEDG
jgi:hypothetical protein